MKIRDRIRELRRVRACDLRPNPSNWRTHPVAQMDAMRGVLAEVGFAGAELAFPADGKGPEGNFADLMLIDGHARAEIAGDAELPVLVTDLTLEEAKKVLATYDPIGAMAEADTGKLDALLREVETGSEAVAEMLSALAEEAGIIPQDNKPTELKQLDTKPPPKMSWVLVGIPTVRYGEVAAEMERIAKLEGVVCETTVNDG